MNHTQLTAFWAVAEAGGFSRAAKKLLVSQPAISLQVGELENALGARLFDRLPRGARLTASGELLHSYARRIFALEQEALDAVREFNGLGRGRLVIGASLTVGSYVLPPLMGQFHQQHPKVELVLEMANTRQVQRMLLDAQLDLGFTEGPGDDAALVHQRFDADRLVPIAPPAHPIFKHKRITLERFCQLPLILRESGSGTRAVVEAALKRKGIDVEPIMSLGSTEAVKRAVQGGIGVAIVSELAIVAELAAGSLRVVPVVDLAIQRPLFLLRRKDQSLSGAASAFVESLPLKTASVPRRISASASASRSRRAAPAS